MQKPSLSKDIRDKLIKSSRENGVAPISLEVVENPDIEPGTYRSSPWQANGNGNSAIYRNGRKVQRSVPGFMSGPSCSNVLQAVLRHRGR